MSGYPDPADFAGFARLDESFKRSTVPGDSFKDFFAAHGVELVKVDSLCLKVSKAGFKFKCHAPEIAGHRLAHKIDIIPVGFKGAAHFPLAVCVAAGCIKEVHPFFYRADEDPFSFIE